jgi:hypothetical protein
MRKAGRHPSVSIHRFTRYNGIDCRIDAPHATPQERRILIAVANDIPQMPQRTNAPLFSRVASRRRDIA